jgi:drug/metabolite transporter (DMT)-like permease
MVKRWEGPIVLLAAALTITLFALTPSTTRIAVTQIDGFSLGIIRSVGAGLLALPIVLILRLRPPNKLQDWGCLMVLAFGNFVGFPLLFGLGVQKTSASHAALIMAVLPLFTGLFGTAIDLRAPRAMWLVGAAIAVLGEAALVIVPSGTAWAEASLAGDLVVLLSCIMFSIGTVAGARLSSRIGAWPTTFWAMILASVGLAPLAVLGAESVSWSILTSWTWVALLHLTVGATICANVCWLFALARGGVARVAPLQFAQPIVGVALAAIILREALTLPLLLAAATIIAGIVIACLAGQKPASEAVVACGEQSGPSPAGALIQFARGARELRRARVELSTMDYRDRKDLGFPAELDTLSGDLESKQRR